MHFSVKIYSVFYFYSGISLQILLNHSFFIYFEIKSWLIAKEKSKKISENIKLHVLEWKNIDSLGKF